MTFDRACPEGNHMVDGSEGRESVIQVGDQFLESDTHIYWTVKEIEGTKVILEPAYDTEICVSERDLEDYFERV